MEKQEGSGKVEFLLLDAKSRIRGLVPPDVVVGVDFDAERADDEVDDVVADEGTDFAEKSG